MPNILSLNFDLLLKSVSCIQGCILLTYLSVISSKFIQKFAQKCQYFTLIDQSLPLDNFYITLYLIDAVGSSRILKGKQKLSVTFNSKKLGILDFTKFKNLACKV